MNWDLELERLRQEAFRPSVPPPVRLPRWTAIALLGAGISLTGAACGGGSSGSGPSGQELRQPASAPPADPMPTDPMPEPTATADPTPVAALVAPTPVPIVTQDASPLAPAMSPRAELQMPAPMKSIPQDGVIYGIAPMDTEPQVSIKLITAPPTGPIPSPVTAYGAPPDRMDQNPEVSSRPTISSTGLIPGDAPLDVKKKLQGLPFMVGSCYQVAHNKGLVGNYGDISVTVSISMGKISVTALGGSLAQSSVFADCVKARLNGLSAGSSEEAANYSKSWTFSVTLTVPAPKTSP